MRKDYLICVELKRERTKMEKIKVLHVLSILPVGGVGSYLKNVLKAIDKSEYDFSFAVCDETKDNVFSDYVKSFGCKMFYSYPLCGKNIKKIKDWYRELFSNNKFDIVEIHSANLAFMCEKSAKKIGNAKVIIHFHSTKYSSSLIKSVRNYVLELRIKKWADYYIACGELVANRMIIKRGINEEKYTVIQNPIEMRHYVWSKDSVELFRKNFVDQEGKICLAVGNCVPVKNYFFLLNVFEELMERKANIKLIIAGTGDLYNEIQKRIEERKINNVFLLGYRRDTHFLMHSSDMLVMPSLYEGLPVTSIEAQYYGLPLLLSSSITREIAVNSNVHFLELSKGVSKWADAIENIILEEKEEPENIVRSNYNIDNQIVRIESIYKELVNE